MRQIENLRELQLRYLNSNRRGKDEILKSLEIIYGYHRKSAIRMLRSRLNRQIQGNRPVKGKKRGVRSRYGDPHFKDALKRMWKELDHMCSKNLKQAMPEWLPFYEGEHGEFLPEIRQKLLTISSSTIDRILKPYKYLGRGRCGTTPGTLLRSEIPISTSCWDVSELGFLEGDTVAHCGGSLLGEFVWSLTATDICSTWTEVRPVWHKGALAVVEAIDDIQEALPFPIKAWDCDNGGEFINRTLVKHFADKKIAFTRSRAYHKNDNAHVEQRNYTHVRLLLGYGRIDNREVMEPLTELLRLWSLLRNHFYPTRKLLNKICLGAKTKKIYDTPRTPYQRVINHPAISQQKIIELRACHQVLNPVLLRKQIRSAVRLLLGHASVLSCHRSDFHVFGNS